MADTSLIFNIIARDKSSGTFDKIKAGAAAAGVAIGALLMSGVAAAIQKSKLDNMLAAQLGATPAQAKEVGKLSGKVYADGFGEDLPAVNAAIRSSVQNGLVDVEKMSASTARVVTENLLTVGTVLEEDSERVSSAVSQMMRTGLASSSEQAMDLLVKATQNGVNKSQDLLDTMNEYGTQFRKLGIDGPQAFGLLSQAIQAGARDSDTAADALKEFAIRAVDGSKTTIDGYKSLGLNAKNMSEKMAAGGKVAADGLSLTLNRLRAIKDPVERSRVAVELFGTKAEDLGDALYAMDPNTAAKAMDGFAGATGRASAQAASGAAGWSTLGRQFQMALVDKLNQALPAITAVFGFLQRNQAWITPLATGLGIIGVVIGIVTAAQWAWNAALALWPGTWIIAGILVLVGVIVYLATKTRFFQTIWAAVWGFLKGVGAWFAGPFTAFFVAAYQRFIAGAMQAWHGIQAAWNGVKAATTAVKNALGAAVDWITGKWNSMVGKIMSGKARLSNGLHQMWDGLRNGFRSAINYVIGKWNSIRFSIPSFSVLGHSFGGGSIGVPRIPAMATGGQIRSDGLIFAHAGEQVINRAGARVTRTGGSRPNGGGGTTITIDGNQAKVVRVLLELLREGIRDKGGDPVKVLTPA